jgi:hypothetical protein
MTKRQQQGYYIAGGNPGNLKVFSPNSDLSEQLCFSN